MKNYQSIPEKMQKHSELIENSINDQAIQEEVVDFGYTPKKLNTGKVLLDEAAEQIVIHGDEYADQKHADNGFKMLRSSINTRFIKNCKLARLALEDTPLLLKVNLGVDGQASDTYSEWISEVDQFYGNALKSEKIITAFAEYNLSSDKLQAEQAEIAKLKALKLKQKKEMGEAQMATKARDKKIAELDAWAKKYKKVAAIAFEDQPQILEKLGILVRS